MANFSSGSGNIRHFATCSFYFVHLPAARKTASQDLLYWLHLGLELSGSEIKEIFIML